MKRNVELLQKTMQHILDHPETHNQLNYWTVCGTPSCFAGWAMHFSGVTQKQVRCGSELPSIYASRILGLDWEYEGSKLFCSSNTREMLELMVKDLVNGDKLQSCQHYYNEAHG